MKLKKLLILGMASVLLVGCGDNSSEEDTSTDVAKVEDVNIVEEAEYVGVFGKDVFYNNIGDYVGCEFDITMIYGAQDVDGKYVFSATEKTAEGSMVGTFRVEDDTEEPVLDELKNYSATDHLAVEMRIVLNEVMYYESDGSDETMIEYEVGAKEATFLPLDSAEAKSARNGYFAAGNMINFKSGLSIYIVDTGSTNKGGINCAYVEIEATNNETESVSLPNPDFYGDNYVLDRAFFPDVDNINGISLAPGRKVRGFYYADLGNGDCSVVEAELFDAIVMIPYSTPVTDIETETATIYGTYTYDNGVDAIVDGEVGFYTDSEEDYIYLAALYYDSNHYSAEVQGTLQPVSGNTFYVKDEITGSVELEVTFMDGGMEVTINNAESDEYNVLEGHYELTSELSLDEVG